MTMADLCIPEPLIVTPFMVTEEAKVLESNK